MRNNLLDEAERQLRQYRIAKEIYDHEGWSYEVAPFQARPQLSIGDSVPPEQDKDGRAQRIEQWLDDGAELYCHGLFPSPDYLARANLAVEIGNNQEVSVGGGATNYIDYCANLGKRTQGDPQRMQHVEISGIENGKISVTFSSAGDEARLVRLTQPVDAGAEGPWNAEICRRIPVSGSGTPAPSTSAGEQEIEVVRTVSSDGKGNTTVTDNSSSTTTRDGSDSHLIHYPPPNASDDSGNCSVTNQPVALAESEQPATNTVATTTEPIQPTQPFIQYGSAYNAIRPDNLSNPSDANNHNPSPTHTPRWLP